MFHSGYKVFNRKKWKEKDIFTGYTNASAGITDQLSLQIRVAFRTLFNI